MSESSKDRNPLHDVMEALFGVHHSRLEKLLTTMERRIMTGMAEVEQEILKVKKVVTDLRDALAAASNSGGATSAQLDQIISDMDAAIAAPAQTPAPAPEGSDTVVAG